MPYTVHIPGGDDIVVSIIVAPDHDPITIALADLIELIRKHYLPR